MKANQVLTIGIDYKIVHGGVAAVETVYSTFYHPFNHVSTVVDYGKTRKLWTFFKALFAFFYWMIFHKEIKIIHIHGASKASFWRKRIFIRIAKIFKKKIVFHCHGAEFKNFTKVHHKAVSKTLNKCDCIIALSESWKKWFEEEFHHPNVVVIKNVIPKPVIKEKSEADGLFRLLFLGRLGKRKGIYDLLDVMIANKEAYNGRLQLLLGGDGDIEEVNQIITNEKLERIVKYEGWVSGNKKVELLNMADAYILPSYNEGLPISVLEAMSYELPIISTRVGGIPEILEDGTNGFIMEPGDKKAIKEAIERLMDDEDLRKKMGQKSALMVKAHLPEHVEKQLKELYDHLLT